MKIVPIMWDGLYHPDAPCVFSNIEEYTGWYKSYKKNLRLPEIVGTVGLIFSRYYWVNKNIEVENALIKKLEGYGIDVIPAFLNSDRDESLGSKGNSEVILEYFVRPDGTSRINAMINLQSYLSGTNNIPILKRLNVPVFAPIVGADPKGFDGSSIGWSIAMPEFEGRIEPIIVGARHAAPSGANNYSSIRLPIDERIDKLIRRILNWIRLQQKPVNERKIAFMLNNNPCASVEASVGGGAHLDTLESVARIMSRMKDSGYVVNPPKNGKELIETIMNRKAISEFRWTTTDEIVQKGGVLKQVTKEEYEEWFNTLSDKVKKQVCDAWGNPPGEEKNGVPAAMVYDGKILVTGVNYGNAVVCVQPKRGCAGARCDGQVCKILHDPEIPPPHQYLATYRYLFKKNYQ